MPAKSPAQERFMRAVAHSPKFAKKAGVPTKVGKEFTKSEGGDMDFKKLFKGKETKGEELKEARAIKSGKITPEQYAKGEKMEKAMPASKRKMPKFAKGGGIECKGKTKGRMV